VGGRKRIDEEDGGGGGGNGRRATGSRVDGDECAGRGVDGKGDGWGDHRLVALVHGYFVGIPQEKFPCRICK